MNAALKGGAAAVTEVWPATALPEPLRSWSGNHTEYPRDKTVAQLFEEIVARDPEAIALVHGSERMSYGKLNERANGLAVKLKQHGVERGSRVAIAAERSIEMIVALIGILKSGAAYVPVDPSYPDERLRFMVENAQPHLVLTDGALSRQALLGSDARVVPVEGLDLSPSELPINARPNLRATEATSPTDLAYVMYTSGSTGRPRGVMVENRAIVRLVRNTNYCAFGPREVFLQYAPISFDASTFEIWGALLNGGRLVLAPSRASLDELGRLIREHGVTTLWLTAGLFHLMVENQLDDLRGVRQLLAGGDVLSPRHVRRVCEELPACTLINGYGPTENTTFTTCHVMRHGETVSDSVPIGRPISNTGVYILDEALQPVAPGQVGELYAAGDGLARGYFNDLAATSRKFVPNPFSPEPGARMYRTGDLAKWLPGGSIEFVGRTDDQVKILGHRVEPAEIEAVLRTHPGLKQVYVMAYAESDGAKRIAAYHVIENGASVSSQELRECLGSKLPAYMVPASFTALPSLPLSPNGKVDRNALAATNPRPNSERNGKLERYATELEEAIAELWRRVLRVSDTGLDDNFFDLGGDSLLLVAVHSNLQKLLNRQIPITDLFEFTTIRKLASRLDGVANANPGAQGQEAARKQREIFERLRQHHTGGAS
jgi:amino acid adenylation domain-containing protein